MGMKEGKQSSIAIAASPKLATTTTAATASTGFLDGATLKSRVMNLILCAGCCCFFLPGIYNFVNRGPPFVDDEFGRIHGRPLFEACQGYRGTIQWEAAGCANNTGDAIPHRLTNFTDSTYALDGLGVTHRIEHLRVPTRLDIPFSRYSYAEYSSKVVEGSTSFVDTINNFLTAEEVDFWQRLFNKYDHDATLHTVAVMGDRGSKYLPFFDRPYAKGLLSIASTTEIDGVEIPHQLRKLQQKLKYFFTNHLKWEDVNGLRGQEVVRNISCVLRQYPPDYVPPREIYNPMLDRNFRKGVIPKSIPYSEKHPHTVTIYLTGGNGIDTINAGGTFFWNYDKRSSGGEEIERFYLPAKPGKLVWFSNYDASDNTNFKMLNTPAPSVGETQLVIQCS